MEASHRPGSQQGKVLAKDVLLEIFSYLDSSQEFAASELVCKSWRDAGLSTVLWASRLKRLTEGKILSRRLLSLMKSDMPRKDLYAFMVADAKRTSFTDLDEISEKIWSLRFLESMGQFWVSKNQSKTGPNKNPLLRRFFADGRYLYPSDDPVFTDPMIRHMLNHNMTWGAWEAEGDTFLQLSDFPPMILTRDPATWGWKVGGNHTVYTVVGVATQEDDNAGRHFDFA